MVARRRYRGKRKGDKAMVLKKDLVIPEGTRFLTAPVEATYSDGIYEAIIGLTKDSAGSVIYGIDDMSPEEIAEWFEVVDA